MFLDLLQRLHRVRYSDPPYLWPASVILAGGLHSMAFILLRTLVLLPTLPSPAPPAIPIQLLRSAPESGTASDAAPTPLPRTAAPASPSTAATPAPEIASTSPQPGSPPTPQALPTPTPTPTSRPTSPTASASASASPSAAATTPTPSSPRPSSPVPSPPPAPGPPAPASPPDPDGSPGEDTTANRVIGQLIPRDIRRNPQGQDFPDQLPQLADGATALALRPALSGCGLANLASLFTLGSGTYPLSLQLTVETDGTISNAEILSGSNQPALDQLVACTLEQTLTLQPAQTAGSPIPTDAVILEVTAALQ
ncbi:hypothetical protein XM38_045210 [Halomicronema hongdechloris C2206]|uniref:TonB C-terminal domain-containing protein n=1 Tax=Halomicronema hongdechloris C2206 TaxID=1641165 RepID=A0A1Z3HTG7_9CYAN|nr:hypothetical protein [Halomicronema hongdechloris]ASC73552.1 hypothetical protein XM38_045210 [Halomicronema hongdechloris C2206]